MGRDPENRHATHARANFRPPNGARSGLIPASRLKGTQGDRVLNRAMRKRLNELRQLAPVDLDTDNIDITAEESLTKLHKLAWGYFLWAHEQTANLTEDKFWITDPRTKEKVPAAEFEFEIRMMGAVRTLAESIVRLEIDKSAAEVEAAKLDLLGAALAAAAEAAGLNDDQRRKLGSELRTQLQLVESTG